MPIHRRGPGQLAGVALAVGMVLASTGPAGAKTPYFSIELTPAEATADRPVLIDVRLWGDPAHTLPGRDDEWARSFADVSPTLESLLVVRTDDVARITPRALTITGRRLDGDAPPLLADVPDGYGASGFQVSGVMFPTEGCWEVTGSVGGHSLSVVVYVMLTPP